MVEEEVFQAQRPSGDGSGSESTSSESSTPLPPTSHLDINEEEGENTEDVSVIEYLCENLNLDYGDLRNNFLDLPLSERFNIKGLIETFYDTSTDYDYEAFDLESELGTIKNQKRDLIEKQKEVRQTSMRLGTPRHTANLAEVQKTNLLIQDVNRRKTELQKERNALKEAIKKELVSAGLVNEPIVLPMHSSQDSVNTSVEDVFSEIIEQSIDEKVPDDSKYVTKYDQYENNEIQRTISEIAGKNNLHDFHKFMNPDYHNFPEGDTSTKMCKTMLYTKIRNVVDGEDLGNVGRSLLSAYNDVNDREKIADWLYQYRILSYEELENYMTEKGIIWEIN